MLIGADPKLAIAIAENESQTNPNVPNGDMNIICKRTGKPVRARGLFQITECYHPEISDQWAFDSTFSIIWAVHQIADEKKCRKEFSTCRQLLKTRSQVFTFGSDSS